jgi:hypothetical protein
VFATQPDAGVSRHYHFVPTIAVVEALETQGWYPVRAQQTAVRDGARQAIARHMVRFRPEPDRQQRIGESVAELVLTNSHDRSAAFQLDLGVFRFACENALITPLDNGGALRIRHAGLATETVVARVLALSQQVPRLAERVEGLQSTLLARAEVERFANAALALRYGEDWQRLSPVTPTDVLTPRRAADANASLWCVFNRVHENLFKGGLSGRSATGRRTQTRAIRRVSENVRLNRGLWALTEPFVHPECGHRKGGQRHGD